jgi:hypothetical protein
MWLLFDVMCLMKDGAPVTCWLRSWPLQQMVCLKRAAIIAIWPYLFRASIPIAFRFFFR